MILLIDNYDSFTYNLYQYVGIFNPDIKVVRNDKITIEEIEKMDVDRIILSPGPKSPKEAGICMDVVKSSQERNQFLVSAWDISASVKHLEEPYRMQKHCFMENSHPLRMMEQAYLPELIHQSK